MSDTTHMVKAPGDRLIGITDWMQVSAAITGREITHTAARKQLERPGMPAPVVDEPGHRRWSLAAVTAEFNRKEHARAVLRGRE